MNNHPKLTPSNNSLNIPTQPSSNSNPKRVPSRRHLVSTIVVIAIAPIIALLMVVYVFQVYEVDGQSMETTLHNNDRLIVLKMPKTWANITGGQYVPDRDEIIVFNQTTSADSVYGQKQLIKRVIGLPGDRVIIAKGKVRIYNNAYPRGFAVDKQGPQRQIITGTSGNVDITVPVGEVFVLGDNRNNSSDSRVFGTVPVEQIVGKLALKFYPFNQTQSF